MKKPVKLLIVDDSSLIRRFLAEIFESDDRFHVIGEAKNGAEALDMANWLEPDAITLDINMPVMDGLTALKNIMVRHPTPVVMVSTLTKSGAKATFDAFKFGAVDFIRKPSQSDKASLGKKRRAILEKVLRAASVQIEAVRYARIREIPAGKKRSSTQNPQYLIALAASQGGYGALLKIVPCLAGDNAASVVVLLDEPKAHVEAFCEYLDQHSAVAVKRAENEALLESGVCRIASADDLVALDSYLGEHRLRIAESFSSDTQGPADDFFSSAAEKWGTRALGVVLSGSGTDGLAGAKRIVERKGILIVQSPETCLRKEKPLRAAEKFQEALVLPDSSIADMINRKCVPAK